MASRVTVTEFTHSLSPEVRISSSFRFRSSVSSDINLSAFRKKSAGIGLGFRVLHSDAAAPRLPAEAWITDKYGFQDEGSKYLHDMTGSTGFSGLLTLPVFLDILRAALP